MVSFWKHRFPEGGPSVIELEELITILQDFVSGFGDRVKPPSSPIKNPVVLDSRTVRH
jgi:hypothetical protein